MRQTGGERGNNDKFHVLYNCTSQHPQPASQSGFCSANVNFMFTNLLPTTRRVYHMSTLIMELTWEARLDKIGPAWSYVVVTPPYSMHGVCWCSRAGSYLERDRIALNNGMIRFHCGFQVREVEQMHMTWSILNWQYTYSDVLWCI